MYQCAGICKKACFSTLETRESAQRLLENSKGARRPVEAACRLLENQKGREAPHGSRVAVSRESVRARSALRNCVVVSRELEGTKRPIKATQWLLENQGRATPTPYETDVVCFREFFGKRNVLSKLLKSKQFFENQKACMASYS